MTKKKKDIQVEFPKTIYSIHHDVFPDEEDKAYVKREVQDNEAVWVIYNTEGERLAQVASRELAFAVVAQNDLIPLSVH